jgi:hypothetical protein
VVALKCAINFIQEIGGRLQQVETIDVLMPKIFQSNMKSTRHSITDGIMIFDLPIMVELNPSHHPIRILRRVHQTAKFAKHSSSYCRLARRVNELHTTHRSGRRLRLVTRLVTLAILLLDHIKKISITTLGRVGIGTNIRKIIDTNANDSNSFLGQSKVIPKKGGMLQAVDHMNGIILSVANTSESKMNTFGLPF